MDVAKGRLRQDTYEKVIHTCPTDRLPLSRIYELVGKEMALGTTS